MENDMSREIFKPFIIGGYEIKHVKDIRSSENDHSYINIQDETGEGIQLFHDEALQLLEWLQQNKEFLIVTSFSQSKRGE